MGKMIDMTGWNMWEHGVPDSKLIVIKQAEDHISPNGTHYTQWLCECNCDEHNIVIVRADSIRNGNTKSCGCILKESAKKQGKLNKKYNKYDLSKGYGIGWTSNTNKEFYFDLEDYDKIKDYCWFECVSQDGYHSLQATDLNNKSIIRMHYLFGCKGWDHIDRNPLNNQKSNLRPATPLENSRNSSIYKNNTSGITGVVFNKNISKWVAQIKLEKGNLYLGCFKNKDDAIKARLKAEAEYFGVFAPQRHLFEEYRITIQNELEDVDELQAI